MEETALYHHTGIPTGINFNYQSTTTNFLLPATPYGQILCIMHSFVKKRYGLLHVPARTQQKQLSRTINEVSDDEGEISFKVFQPNLAEVLKTKMLESEGFRTW